MAPKSKCRHCNGSNNCILRQIVGKHFQRRWIMEECLRDVCHFRESFSGSQECVRSSTRWGTKTRSRRWPIRQAFSDCALIVRSFVRSKMNYHEPLLATVKRRKLAWLGHVTRHDGLSKKSPFGARVGGRQRKDWMDNIKEWTFLPMPELPTIVSHRKKGEDLCWIVHHLPPHPTHSDDPVGKGTVLNQTEVTALLISSPLSAVLVLASTLVLRVTRLLCLLSSACSGMLPFGSTRVHSDTYHTLLQSPTSSISLFFCVSPAALITHDGSPQGPIFPVVLLRLSYRLSLPRCCLQLRFSDRTDTFGLFTAVRMVQ